MNTRNIEEARKAYDAGDVYLSLQAHEGFIQHNELSRKTIKIDKSLIDASFYGMITIICIVSASNGSECRTSTLVTFAVALLIGKALVLAIQEYLDRSHELNYQRTERKREEWEVDNNPAGEKKEMVEIYMNKGIDEADAKEMVEILSKHKAAWIDIMMVEELGILENKLISPLKNAFMHLAAFAIFATFPMLPYFVGAVIDHQNSLFLASIILSGFMLFVIGAIKAEIGKRDKIRSGLESIALGAIASGGAFLMGFLLKPILHQMMEGC